MPDEPISNPGVTPTPGTPEYGRDKPRLGEGEEAQEPKPFSLPPEPGIKQGAVQIPTEKPSPMDVAREGARKPPQLSPEELSGQVQKLKGQLDDAQNNLQNPNITSKFTTDHYQALNRLVEKMNPDMQTIAKSSQGEFAAPKAVKGEPVLSFISRWIDGSQETLSQSLNYLSKGGGSTNPADYLKLQFGVQRATQRGELFASIIGASVSGIKTIMSTQLG